MRLVIGGLGLAHVDELARCGVENVEAVDKPVGEDLAGVLDEPPEDAVEPDPEGPELVLALGKAESGDTVGGRLRPHVGERGGEGQRKAVGDGESEWDG